MKRKFTFVIFCISLLATFYLCGCKATLQPGGAYAPVVVLTNSAGVVVTNTVVTADMGFYLSDSTFVLAESALDTVFRFERDNRTALWRVSPNIKHTLDKIRPDAVQAVMAYKSARSAYRANPTPGGLDLLQTILSKVQAVSTAAAAAVTNLNLNIK